MTERSIQNIHLADRELLDLVHKAFPNCHQIDEYKILSGGALNTTYKLRIEGKEIILRLYVRDRALCKVEKEIHRFIESKVLAPHLIYSNEMHPPFSYAIFQFIDGVPISELPMRQKEILSYELGKTLAAIHAFKFQEAGLFGDGMKIVKPFEKGSSPYFEETFSILSKGKFIRKRFGEKLTEEMLSFIQKYQDFFPRVENNVCLTHSDFKPVNLLYSKEQVFVLDWEFAHAGIGILDFAILLRHRDQFPFSAESLTKGYRDWGGSLPKEWLRSALITDFINIATLVEAPPDRPQLFRHLKNAVMTTMKQWDHLG